MFNVFKNLLGIEEFSFVTVQNYFLIHFWFKKSAVPGVAAYSYLDKGIGRSVVLEFLCGEWSLAPSAYRTGEGITESKVSMSGLEYDLVSEPRGLEITIAPNRLLVWCKETGLTPSQIEPILATLVPEKFLRSFEFFDGQWSDFDEPELALRICFETDFEQKSIQYKKRKSI